MRKAPPQQDRATPIAPMELAGGRYVIDAVLGSGGMATVYRAFDRHLAVHRAVKVLSPELADRPAIRARFIAEARAMARLRHPHVVSIQDVIDSEGRIFIVMDLIRGGTSWQRVSRQGTLSEGEAVALLAPIADAVAAAHTAGIVHRDIKPHNILLTEEGAGRLSDFGIAQLDDASSNRMQTRTGTVMGTWGFMPPEQRNDASRVEPRSDIYALGATMWALVRGVTPTDLFMSDREPDMMDGLSPAFAALIQKATRYRPSERHKTAAAFAQALRDIAPGLSEHPVAPTIVVPPVAIDGQDTGDTLMALLEARQTPDVAHGTDALTQLRPPSFQTVMDAPAAPAHHGVSEGLSLAVPPPQARGFSSYVLAAVVLMLAVGAFATLGTRLSELPPSSQVSLVQPPEDAGVAVAPGPASEPRPAKESSDPPQAPHQAEPASGAPTVASASTESQTASDAAAAPEERPPPPVAATQPKTQTAVPGAAAEPEVGTAAPPETDASTPPRDDRPPAGRSEGSEPPPVELGQVDVVGTVHDMWLEDASGAQFEAGKVPVGQYKVWAMFEAGGLKAVAGDVEVVGDEAIQLMCSPEFKKCVIQP